MRDTTSTSDLRSFGRRRGRRPSARQGALLADALPRYAIDIAAPAPAAVASLFKCVASEVWLEIGFGGGEHLISVAARNPCVGFIGCEPFVDGVVKALSAAEKTGLRNLRIFPDDARSLLRWLPPASLGRVFILFPDPWPKKRHAKRRLVNEALLALLARSMAPGAELRLATDIGDYAGAMLRAIHANGSFAWRARSPADWRERPPDWPATRYEGKALAAGRRPYYLRLVRKSG